MLPIIMESQQEAVGAIRRLTKFNLRYRYPYMKTDTLENFLDKIEADCQKFLIEQEPEYQATKSRINFFSLPAECRNRIYELGLVDPHKDIRPRYDGLEEDSISLCWHRRPSLLSVSQSVRKEVLPMYYATTLHWSTTPNLTPPSLTCPAGFSLKSNSVTTWRSLDMYLSAIGSEQTRLIKDIKIVFDDRYLRWPFTNRVHSSLEQLIASGNLNDQKVVEQILQAYNLLGYGVPREAWRIARASSPGDETTSDAAPEPLPAEPQVTESTQDSVSDEPSDEADETTSNATPRQSPAQPQVTESTQDPVSDQISCVTTRAAASCASIEALAPPKTLRVETLSEDRQKPRKKNWRRFLCGASTD